MNKIKSALVGSVAGLMVLTCINTTALSDDNHAIEARVKSLVDSMTLQEKVSMVTGVNKPGYTGYVKAIPRLGIPALRLTDGPVGIRSGNATAFPASIATASTWNIDLAFKLGQALGREAKAKGQDVLLGPCINILRVPMGGRSFEGFGEDPYLVSQLTVPYIKGVQSQGVIADAKHYAVNNQEEQRGSINTIVDERTLREIYLPAFRAAVQDAGVLSVMAAYNKLNGAYCSQNAYLLKDVLKGDWGFKGFVVSDWGATHSTTGAANGGMDLEMPNGAYWGSKLTSAVKNNSVSEATLNDMVTRILRAMAIAGILDAATQAPPDLVSSKENRQIALELAREGIAVSYTKGTELDGDPEPIPSGMLSTISEGKEQQGLKAEYFNNMTLSGKPILTRVDKEIDFNWGDGAPAAQIENDGFSVRWTGKFIPNATGRYSLSISSDDGMRLYIGGKQLISHWGDHATETKVGAITLEAGKSYDIKIEYYENGGLAEARLGWIRPGVKKFEEAAKLAAEADVAVVFAGFDASLDSEGSDRKDLRLPGDQDSLISTIAAANPKTVVVLNNGSAVLMEPWLDKVSAVVEAWYPGQEGSQAMTEILFGDVNPSGKLPMTFPKNWQDVLHMATTPVLPEKLHIKKASLWDIGTLTPERSNRSSPSDLVYLIRHLDMMMSRLKSRDR